MKGHTCITESSCHRHQLLPTVKNLLCSSQRLLARAHLGVVIGLRRSPSERSYYSDRTTVSIPQSSCLAKATDNHSRRPITSNGVLISGCLSASYRCCRSSIIMSWKDYILYNRTPSSVTALGFSCRQTAYMKFPACTSYSHCSLCYVKTSSGLSPRQSTQTMSMPALSIILLIVTRTLWRQWRSGRGWNPFN